MKTLGTEETKHKLCFDSIRLYFTPKIFLVEILYFTNSLCSLCQLLTGGDRKSSAWDKRPVQRDSPYHGQFTAGTWLAVSGKTNESAHAH